MNGLTAFGLMSVLLDGVVLDSFDFVGPGTSATLRDTLDFTTNLTAGQHTIQLQATRIFAPGAGVTSQYFEQRIARCGGGRSGTLNLGDVDPWLRWCRFYGLSPSQRRNARGLISASHWIEKPPQGGFFLYRAGPLLRSKYVALEAKRAYSLSASRHGL